MGSNQIKVLLIVCSMFGMVSCTSSLTYTATQPNENFLQAIAEAAEMDGQVLKEAVFDLVERGGLMALDQFSDPTDFPYAACVVDSLHDGVLDLSDVVLFARQMGKTCPEIAREAKDNSEVDDDIGCPNLVRDVASMINEDDVAAFALLWKEYPEFDTDLCHNPEVKDNDGLSPYTEAFAWVNLDPLDPETHEGIADYDFYLSLISGGGAVCGDGIIEEGETCEGTDLNGRVCSDFSAFESGTLSCVSCAFDFSACTAREVLGQPSILVAPSNFSDGQTVSIQGTTFGPKDNAAPIKWDTFEAGSNDDFLDEIQPEWTMYKRADASCRYSDTWVHSGRLAVANRTTWRSGSMSGFNTNYFDVPFTDELFVSYWYSTRLADPTDYIQYKPTRLNASDENGNTGGGRYNGTGNHSLTVLMPTNGNPESAHFSIDNGPEGIDLGYVGIPHNRYNHIQDYRKLSTPGEPNGIEEVHVVGRSHNVNHGVVSRASGETFQLDTVLLGLMYANWGQRTTTADGAEVYIDDVYIDNTQARVELGNDADFETCTHREMQIPTAWADGEISFTVNKGTFGQEGPLFLFVVNRDGKASVGFPVN